MGRVHVYVPDREWERVRLRSTQRGGYLCVLSADWDGILGVLYHPHLWISDKRVRKAGEEISMDSPCRLSTGGAPGHLPVGMGQLFDAVWCERMKGVGDHAGAAEEDAGIFDL